MARTKAELTPEQAAKLADARVKVAATSGFGERQ